MPRIYQRIEAPSILGLKPSGVELLPYALQVNGFLVNTSPALRVPFDVKQFSDQRLSKQDVLNAEALADFSVQLADTITAVRDTGAFPVVLGGDCSILIGCMLALKRVGRFGLAHVDAHADFYQPEANGEAASMDLALVVGRGPSALTNLEDQQPYVEERHVVQLGQRDQDEAQQAGSQRIEASAIHGFDEASIQQRGVQVILSEAIPHLTKAELADYWIHFDVDVLADAIMPAVDYRLPGGLSFAQASALLQGLLKPTTACGLSISIFNPKLDSTGQLTRELVACLHHALGYA